MNTPLDPFETALLVRLREHVVQPPPARRLSRPRLVAGAAAAVAAAAAVFVVAPGTGTPAYSVQKGNSGTITVEVHRLQDAEGLEAALAAYGVVADITYLPHGQQCAPGWYEPVPRRLSGMGVSLGTELLRVTLPPGTVRDGETFVMAVSGGKVAQASSAPAQDGVTNGAEFHAWSEFDVSAGPVRPCTVVPDPTD